MVQTTKTSIFTTKQVYILQTSVFTTKEVYILKQVYLLLIKHINY